MKFDITFNLGHRTYGVEADTEEEAEEKAMQELQNDSNYNVCEFIQDTEIEKLNERGDVK